MPKYNDFIKSFKTKIPKFLENEAKNITEDIISVIHKGIKNNGIQIRGHFSIKAEQKSKRKSIRFRDLNPPCK